MERFVGRVAATANRAFFLTMHTVGFALSIPTHSAMRCSASITATLLCIALWTSSYLHGTSSATRLAVASNASALTDDSAPSAKLRVSSNTIDHLDSVTVHFELTNGAPSERDVLVIYCVDDEQHPPPDREYIDFRIIEQPARNFVVVDRIPNMRCSWQFRYWKRVSGDSTYQSIGSSEYVRMRNGDKEPLQVHLAMTNTTTEMRVLWVSGVAGSDQKVVYGKTPETLDQSAEATTSTYTASDMCHEPATQVAPSLFRDVGMIYDAVMTELTPGATYYYRVGNPHGLFSKIFKFTVPPAPGTLPSPPDNATMSFFVYGDMNDWNIRPTGPVATNRTLRSVEFMRAAMDGSNARRSNQSPHYIAAIHVGDIAYGMGRTYIWDQFGFLIEAVAAELPYMVAVGNHEYDYIGGAVHDPSGVTAATRFLPQEGNYGGDSGGECGVPVSARFRMPADSRLGSNGVFWYSFATGLVHHSVISSEHDFTNGSVMTTWLVNDLQSVDREKTPWLVLHLHRPMYCSSDAWSDFKFSRFLRLHLEPLLAKYRVDLVFSGHYHSYERTCPVFQGRCFSEKLPSGLEKAHAPVHIMVGSAGADLDTSFYYKRDWSVKALLAYGIGHFHVYNRSHAEFEFQHHVDGRIADSAWIISDHDWDVPVVYAVS